MEAQLLRSMRRSLPKQLAAVRCCAEHPFSAESFAAAEIVQMHKSSGTRLLMRTCTVCRHPEREAINAALIAQEPFRRLASRTGTTTGSLRRHKAAHLPLTLSRAVREVEVVQAMSLLEQMQMLQAKTMTILAKAEAAGDFHIALLAIREGRANAELLERCLEKEREEGSVGSRLRCAAERAD